MSDWYYSTGPDQRLGPVDEHTLLDLDRRGVLRGEHLVWRDGMADWQHWASQREALLATHAPPALAGGGTNDAVARSPYAAPAAPLHAASNAVVHGGEVVYAGFWKRTAAVIIDGIVVTMASYAVQLPLIAAMGLGGASAAMDSKAGLWGLLGVVYALSLLIPAIYYAWMQSSSQQATLGKMAVGIKVTRTDGQRISFLRAFGRYFGYILSSLLLMVGLIMAAFTERKQALHDFMCDTLVVDKWAFTDRPQWQRRELGAVTWIVLVIGIGLVGLGMLGIIAAIAIPAMSR